MGVSAAREGPKEGSDCCKGSKEGLQLQYGLRGGATMDMEWTIGAGETV